MVGDLISCWLVDCCPQWFSFRYFFRSQMCYFHLCFFSLFVQLQCNEFEWWYLWCCFAVFVFLLPRDWPVYWLDEWYMVFLMIWCLVCLICVPFARYFLYGYIRLFALQLGSVDSFINRLVDWSIDPSMFDWLVDRPIDWLIHWLAGCWLGGYSGSFLRSHLLVFIFPVPCAHERCDPWEFLLVLRGFVELISVMVRFRTRCYFVPPGDDWRTPHLEP